MASVDHSGAEKGGGSSPLIPDAHDRSTSNAQLEIINDYQVDNDGDFTGIFPKVGARVS